MMDKEGTFRDSVGWIKKDGKRAWIYAKKPSGKLYKARTLVSIILLAVFFGMPFIKVNDHPLMLFNVIERKFIILGISFFPQDFFLFVLAMLTFIMFIILFTVLFGRLWCGWACPQTIFMEMVFRKIEYFIEGDAAQQKSFDNTPRSPGKFFKKMLKHFVFFAISFLIANMFLSYIIGVDELKRIITDSTADHAVGLIALVLFTLVFYGVYARFREQACLVVCPYGRLQGVLLDPNSVVIGYDYKRGEPRGKLHKGENREIGDCIDCHQCVQVCPTGIDIRNGTQLECVNCTACIDACNGIMDRIGKPHGLIRYTSEKAIATKEKFKVTPRVIGYSLVLFVLLTTLVTLLVFRSDIETTVLRTPGLLYQKLEGNRVSNLYNVKMINKTFHDIQFTLKLVEPRGEIKWVGSGLHTLKKEEIAEGEFFLVLNSQDVKKTKTQARVQVISNEKVIDETETTFLGPNN